MSDVNANDLTNRLVFVNPDRDKPMVKRIVKAFAELEVKLAGNALAIAECQREVQSAFADLGFFPSVALVGSNKNANGDYNFNYGTETPALEFGEAMASAQAAASQVGLAHRMITKALYDQKILTGGGGK